MTPIDHDIGVLINPDLAALHPSPTNPRKTFEEADLVELSHSIQVYGVMQPIVVRELNAEQRARMGTDQPLEIVAGERRYRASMRAGMHTIPAVLRDLSDEQVIRLQITENLQRVGLSPLEEAEGYEALRAQGLTPAEIAIDVGKSKAYIYAKLKLLALTDICREHLRRGDMSEAVALLIARFPAGLQGRAMSRACQPDLDGERPSYRAAQRILRENFMVRLDARTLQFDPTDATLLPDMGGACTDCPSRMGTDPECEPENADVCTNTACYARKTAAGIGARQAAQSAAETAPGNTPSQADDPNDHPEDTLDMVTPDAPTAAEFSADVDQAEASFSPPKAPAKSTTTTPARGRTALRDAVTAPLRAAWDAYRGALSEQIISNPPLFVAGPLLRVVAKLVSEDTDYHLEFGASEGDAMAIILRIVTERLSGIGRYQQDASLEDIATLVGIDPAALLAHHFPVPEGCARPNEHGVFPSQEDLEITRGKSSVRIHLARTTDGWRTGSHLQHPTVGCGGGISIFNPAHLTRDEAAAAEAGSILKKSMLDDIPQKDRTPIKAWLEAIAAGMPAPAESTSRRIRYRHPENMLISWSGHGRKPQWVVDLLANGNTLDELASPQHP